MMNSTSNHQLPSKSVNRTVQPIPILQAKQPVQQPKVQGSTHSGLLASSSSSSSSNINLRKQSTEIKVKQVNDVVVDRIGKMLNSYQNVGLDYDDEDEDDDDDEDEFYDEDDEDDVDEDEDEDELDPEEMRKMNQFLALEKIIDEEVAQMQMLEQLTVDSEQPNNKLSRSTSTSRSPKSQGRATTGDGRLGHRDSDGHRQSKESQTERALSSAMSASQSQEPNQRISKNSASASSFSSSSSWSAALPPITYDQLHKGRFVFDSVTFFDSFFGANELERYFPDGKLRLAILTWNMSSKAPADYNQTLQQILQLKMPNESVETLPELYVIGLQETPKSEVIVANIKIGIQAVLGPHYVLLQWSAVGALHASIWIRRELLWSCTTVEMVPIHSRPTAANRIRTKGAIALSFGIFGTSFLFINTHLSAHETNLRTRINQLDKVQQTLNIKVKQNFGGLGQQQRSSGKNSISSLHSSPLSSTSQATPTKDGSSKSGSQQSDSPIRDHITRGDVPCQRRNPRHSSEYIFWFGDLNFRLELPMENVLESIEAIASAVNEEERTNSLHQLMRSDQLTNLMARGMVFDGFNEALWPPPFLPTYKCLINGRPSTVSMNLAGVNLGGGGGGSTSSGSSNTGANQKSATSTKSLSSESNSSIQSIGSTSAISNSSSVNTVTTSASSLLASNRLNELQQAAHFRENLLNIYNCDSGRVPSYTDRILYQASVDYETVADPDQSEMNDRDQRPESNIRCLQYDAISSIGSSDHKPVYGLFEVKLESGGPRLPLRLRQLGETSDGIKVKKKKLVKELSFDLSLAAAVPDQIGTEGGGGTGSGSNVKNISFFGHRFNKKGSRLANGAATKVQHHPLRDSRTTSNLQHATQAALSASLSSLSLPTSSSSASLGPGPSSSQQQQCSMASLVAAATASKLGNLTRLNAGAFERQVFVDGLRLRNRLLQGYLSAAEKQFKQQQLELQQRRASLFKSRSFDSNMAEPSRHPSALAVSVGSVSPISPLVHKNDLSFLLDSSRSRMELHSSGLRTEYVIGQSQNVGQPGAAGHQRTSSNVCQIM